MKTFSVFIEGDGFEISSDEDKPIRGFFVTRIVRALNKEAAKNEALLAIKKEWREGRFKHLSITPNLIVSEVCILSFWGRLRAKNTGYVFWHDE